MATATPTTAKNSAFKRPWYLRVPFAPSASSFPEHGSSGSASDAVASPSPELSANWWSLLTFGWMTPILALGYTRPLEAHDLYETLEDRRSRPFAQKVDQAFAKRRKARPKLPAGKVLMGALRDAFGTYFWIGVSLKMVADAGTMCSPLLIRSLTKFAQESYQSPNPPPINKGIGLSLGLFFLQLCVVIFNAHAFYRSFGTGVLIRGTLIHLLFEKAMLCSPAQAQNTAKLFTLMSSDLSRLDFASGYLPVVFTAPIQLAICLALLIYTMGWPAIPGFMLIIVLTPMQGLLTRKLFVLRHRSMKFTERRIGAIKESIGNMRVVKWFAWEVPYLDRISKHRHQEMLFLRTRLVWRSLNNALAFSLPTLASVVSIVVYSHNQTRRGREMDPGVIFSSLAWFNLMRVPMQFLPIAMNAMADAKSALERVGKAIVIAPASDDNDHHELDEKNVEKVNTEDENEDLAVKVVNATFAWPSPAPPTAATKKPVSKPKTKPKPKAKKSKGVAKKDDNAQTPPSGSTTTDEIEKPIEKSVPVSPPQFTMRDVDLSIPKGSFCAIVGPVGGGKSTLVGGLVGETILSNGTCTVNGDVAYCAQSAWLQSTSIRDNILFGMEYDEARYQRVLEDCCLLDDLKLLPNGDKTQVGEKGISLSGGQKQRVNLARALYRSASITILDDSFSALDVNVSNKVFDNLLRRHDFMSSSKQGGNEDENKRMTTILVTHSLTLAKRADMVAVVDLGKIVEIGSCEELLERNGAFRRMVDDFGAAETVDGVAAPSTAAKSSEKTEKKEEKAHGGGPIDEERFRGGVSWLTYRDYLFSAHIGTVLPLITFVILVYQGSSVMANYWLVLWQRQSFVKSEGFYMGIYAALGVGQALGMFSMGVAFAIMTYYSSKNLHGKAMKRLMYAPISFFDTTPLGRILNRLSKDIDTIDNIIGDAIRMFIGTVVQIVGAVVLISILQPYFLIAVSVITILYYWAGAFYRPSAREIRRLDALLRSKLYAHFSESLAGASTIRAYRVQRQFIDQNAKLIDIENRAYWLSIANQRWLSMRLDTLGSLLILAVGMLVVGARFELSPAKTGVMLSYILTVQTTFGWMIRNSAEVENNMNAVERILYYAHNVPQEPSVDSTKNPPPKAWPSGGAIHMESVQMSHRPGLPLALKNLSLSIQPKEHIGIVGRTGAGKSTLVSALFRLTELTSGRITIDGKDISTLSLHQLRRAIAMIPQDPQLFSGTLRSNLDPFNSHNDVTLNAALRDAGLLEDGSIDEKDALSNSSATQLSLSDGKIKLGLDSEVKEDGANLSIGQRSLVALARALVKDSKIVVLDEATASIDYSTERHIQQTLVSSFNDRTLLCIAHRLQTIIGFDRICVLEKGDVIEVGGVLELYQIPGGVFRGMCERAGISEDELVEAQKARRRMTDIVT